MINGSRKKYKADINKINEFVDKVESQSGWIDHIDSFRLVSLYTDFYGIKYFSDISIEEELSIMWSGLRRIKYGKK